MLTPLLSGLLENSLGVSAGLKAFYHPLSLPCGPSNTANARATRSLPSAAAQGPLLPAGSSLLLHFLPTRNPLYFLK